MPPKLLAFDLDGTLLQTDKALSPANRAALLEMAESGAMVALASGRLGSSMMQYARDLDIDIAMLTLNGAAVYAGHADHSHLVYESALPAEYAEHLVAYADGADFAINYYLQGKLYTVRTEANGTWVDLYYKQTRTPYVLVESLTDYAQHVPSKIIFVGDVKRLDAIEEAYRKQWGSQVYICRTWDHYLEFLNLGANKGNGLRALAKSLDIDMADVVAFGDAENDIPMLEAAGTGIAMRNAPDFVKRVAHHVSPWTNDEDGVAREWERLKREG
jgi:hypothetical protein